MKPMWIVLTVIACGVGNADPKTGKYDFSCESFLKQGEIEQQMLLLGWLEGTRAENQYYRLNTMTESIERAANALDEAPSINSRTVREHIRLTRERLDEISELVGVAELDPLAFFSKVEEYCARPDVQGATVLEIIPHALRELGKTPNESI